jgi:hypothetical protein
MTTPETFTSSQVEDSFRKFEDLAADLMKSRYQTWPDAMTHFITHCETDPVMQVVTAPLTNDPRVDAKRWWDDAIASATSMTGSGHYTLPTDDDERTALLYKVLLLIEYTSGISLPRFCVSVYGTTKHQESVEAFNDELVYKFIREVSYRLKNVSATTKGQPVIRRESVVVFHNHNYSTTITGNIYGSNIATGKGRISGSPATINSAPEMAEELRHLKMLAEGFSRVNQAAIKSSLDYLADHATDDSGDIATIAEHARTVAEISPPIRSRLSELITGIGTSMAGSAIIEGIKLAMSQLPTP